MNIAWGDVKPTSDVQKLPSVAARNTIAQVDDRAGNKRSIPSSPYKYKHLKSQVGASAPHSGEHNEEVLKQWLELVNGTDKQRPIGVINSNAR